MTPAQITVLVVDVLSAALLGLGLLLHRNLTADRHAFQSVLHTDRTLPKPRRMGFLAWTYVLVTIVIIFFSISPFFG